MKTQTAKLLGYKPLSNNPTMHSKQTASKIRRMAKLGQITSPKGTATAEDERSLLESQINRLKHESQVATRRRAYVKLLDAAIRQQNGSAAMSIGARICAMDSEWCFDMTEKKYLRSMSV